MAPVPFTPPQSGSGDAPVEDVVTAFGSPWFLLLAVALLIAFLLVRRAKGAPPAP